MSLTLCLFLNACQTLSDIPKTQSLIQEAHKKAMEYHEFQSSTFLLSTWHRLDQADHSLIIYIEGDGHSMNSRTQVSEDPTPHQALAFALAQKDPRANVVYLARSCQYLLTKDPLCEPKYWTSHRFSKEVRQAILEAIEYYQHQSKATSITLIGYSGGATLAVFAIPNLKIPTRLITIAGDLSHKDMQIYHKSSALLDDCDPITLASKLINIPQVHWIGKKDTVVPPNIATLFTQMQKGSLCWQIKVAPNTTHHQGWIDAWPEYLKVIPQCQNQASL